MKLQIYKENLFLEIETSFFRDPGYRLSRNFSFKLYNKIIFTGY